MLSAKNICNRYPRLEHKITWTYYHIQRDVWISDSTVIFAWLSLLDPARFPPVAICCCCFEEDHPQRQEVGEFLDPQVFSVGRLLGVAPNEFFFLGGKKVEVDGRKEG